MRRCVLLAVCYPVLALFAWLILSIENDGKLPENVLLYLLAALPETCFIGAAIYYRIREKVRPLPPQSREWPQPPILH
jgi:hypothetical protein